MMTVCGVKSYLHEMRKCLLFISFSISQVAKFCQERRIRGNECQNLLIPVEALILVINDFVTGGHDEKGVIRKKLRNMDRYSIRERDGGKGQMRRRDSHISSLVQNIRMILEDRIKFICGFKGCSELSQFLVG